jgi:uncharacterized protein with GYD domain
MVSAEEGRYKKYPKKGKVICTLFIMLAKDKERPTKKAIDSNTKKMEELKKKGLKILGFYWTLGRYDDVIIFEAPNEKEAMKLAFEARDNVDSETMVAIPREEGVKLL